MSPPAATSGRTTPSAASIKTVDGGKTWEKVLFVNDETGANDLVMDPRSSDTLYAATLAADPQEMERPAERRRVRREAASVKTTDGGKTWTPDQRRACPRPSYRGRIGLDLCLTKPDILYALVDNYENAREPTRRGAGRFLRRCPPPASSRAPRSTAPTTPARPGRQVSGLTPAAEDLHGAPFRDLRLGLRPDPGRSQRREHGLHHGRAASASRRDGGKTFQRVRGPGGDHHALWIDPANSNYLLNGFDQGLAVSYDKGKNWRYFRERPPRLPVLQPQLRHGDAVQGLRLDAGPRQLPGARSTSAAAATASRPRPSRARPGGEGSNHAIDPTNPNIVYSAGFYGTISRAEYDKPGRVPGPAVQQDAPAPSCTRTSRRLRGQWLAPFILSPHNPNILYHGMQYVFRSLDRGDTWERISPDLTTNDPARWATSPTRRSSPSPNRRSSTA